LQHRFVPEGNRWGPEDLFGTEPTHVVPAAGHSGTTSRKTTMTFEYWQSEKDSAWYWHLKSGNGETIAQGEGYARKEDCLHAIDLIRDAAAVAEIVRV
jgi:uncharacterized protein YegP (UPF0339 family)